MKNLKVFFTVVAIILACNSGFSQSPSYSVTSCAQDMVIALNNLVNNIGTTSCYSGVDQVEIILNYTCSQTSYVGPPYYNTSPNYLYANRDANNPTQAAFGLIYAARTAAYPTVPPWGTDPSWFVGGKFCVPSLAYYANFSIVSPNNMDYIGIKRYDPVSNSLVDELVNDITQISNPRMITPLHPMWNQFGGSSLWWNLSNAGVWTAMGILVDVTTTTHGPHVGMLFNNYNYNFIMYKESCPSYLDPSYTACQGSAVTLSVNCPVYSPGTSYFWNFGDGVTGTGNPVSHTYLQPGNYTLTCTQTVVVNNAVTVFTAPVQVNNCPVPATCKSCIGSFAPDPGDYIVSLWVKEDNTNNPNPPPKIISYPSTGISISFSAAAVPPGQPQLLSTTNAFANGPDPVIDGWKRIEMNITVPSNAAHMGVELLNNNSAGIDAYFDDIRIFPKDATMKSYVYDPVTLRLSAELDENNYATFYEYDEEGKLVRVKKETQKGVMTIKESRISNKKQ